MPLEVELKYVVDEFTSVRSKLETLGAQQTASYFESNRVLDTPDRKLKGLRMLLRLRQGRTSTLTLKKPSPRGPSPFKVREELETEVSDPDQILSILRELGFEIALVYEKVRETWLYGGCAICLDRLAFGKFVEIEGPPEAIRSCARVLGLDERSATSASYHRLHKDHLEANGLQDDDSFPFPEPLRSVLLAEHGQAGSVEKKGGQG